MLQWATGIVESMGFIGIVLLMMLENLVPPIPSEVIMPLAGYTASRGEMSLGMVILAGTVGSVLGALPLYGVGRWVGPARVRRFIEKRGRWLGLSVRDLDRAERWFDRRGAWAVLICRVIPGARSLISIPAGVRKMNLGVFLLATALGTATWTALLAGLGWVLGEQYAVVGKWVSYITWALVGLAIVACIAWVARRRRRLSSDPDA